MRVSLVKTILPCLACLLQACSLFTQRTITEETTDATKDLPPEMAGFMGNPLLPGANNPNAINMKVTSEADLKKVEGSTAEDEIIWTDPDNLEESEAEINAVFEKRLQGNGWLNNYGKALKLSRRQGLPIIIWFHDSITSPKSKELGRTLLETPEFDAYCEGRVIRIKIDSGAAIDDSPGKSSRYSLSAINRLAGKYGIDRRPGVVVISPHGGKVTARINGMGDYLYDIQTEIEAGVEKAEADYKAYKQKLKAKGYREWTSRKGNSTIFAKLMRFDEKNNFVYLKDPGGKVTKTRLESFSADDISYLDSISQDKATR
ncbi:MAG: hypothetical protein E7031_05465 [Akkermansiaceae bacterium]|nr:hypothetical protein [Akkermansiaceae bacterium]